MIAGRFGKNMRPIFPPRCSSYLIIRMFPPPYTNKNLDLYTNCDPTAILATVRIVKFLKV